MFNTFLSLLLNKSGIAAKSRKNLMKYRFTLAFLTLLMSSLFLSGCGGGDSSDGIDEPKGNQVLSITGESHLIVDANNTKQLVVTLDGNSVSASGVEWISQDTSIVTVDSYGLAIGVATGKTTVKASQNGVSDATTIEVYIPDTVSEYIVGTSYYGRNNYIQYIPGDLPLILSAPHGGAEKPSEIAERSYGSVIADASTAELTLAIRDAIIARTGHAPHVIISNLHRSRLDANREIDEAAQDNVFAEQAWKEFQDYIVQARTKVVNETAKGLYLDIHGHGHEKQRLEIGYLLSNNRLNQDDTAVDGMNSYTSIRDLSENSVLTLSELVRGSTSLGAYLENQGVPSIPSADNLRPNSDPYWEGGYNTVKFGSRTAGETISGIQIEHNRIGVRDTEDNRRIYADKFAVAIENFMQEHYGFFVPTL